MPRPIFRTLVVAALCVAYVGFADAFTLRSVEGHFTAEFPEEPKLAKQTLKSDDGTPLEQYTWQVDKGNTVYSVSVIVSKSTLKFDYENGTNGFVTTVKGKLIDHQTFQLQGKTGREIFVAAGGHMFRDRMIFFNQRLYQILYGGAPGSEKSQAAETFLNSVRLNN